MVLLIVDAQKAITTPTLHRYDEFVDRVAGLIGCARQNGVEVIYVRHDDGPGGPLTRGCEGFEIFEDFRPNEGERVFDKRVNSAFRDTGLAEYLQEQDETEIMVAGLQTDHCMDATIKAGFERSFRMIVPDGTNSTVDNPFMSAARTYDYYNRFLWNKRFAECIAFREALLRIQP